jgi:hypothetical protein
MAIKRPNPDSSGYIKYYAADSLKADEQLFSQNDLFYVDFGAYGGATPSAGGGCNIDFGTFFDIDWNLDFLQFDIMPAPFDTSLFDKCDALSIEVAMINDMLINSILDMECCDIADVYNSTLIPFFKFFGDSEGDSLVSVLIRFAEIITMWRAIVEPLECLVRFVPNNPWLPKDVDFLAWIYGYFKKTAPFLNRILSGEIVDMVLNPIHQVRTKLQACLFGGEYNGWDFGAITEIGSAQQLEAISALAAKNGNTVVDYSPPPMDKPIKPNVKDYGGNENDMHYKEAMRLYTREQKRWEFYLNRQKTIQEEEKRRSIEAQKINQHLGVTAQTKAVIKIRTNGLCGCVADAMGIKEITIDNIPFRTTSDLLDKVVGKTHSKATYKDIGAVSKNEPKTEKATIQKKHIENKATKAKIVKDCEKSGSKSKKVVEEKQKVTTKNPYYEVDKSASKIETEVVTYKATEGAAPKEDPNLAILNANDKNEKKIKEQQQAAKELEADKDLILLALSLAWTKEKEETEKILLEAKANIGTLETKIAKKQATRAEIASYTKGIIEYEVARDIFNSYFGTFRPIDFENDPEDYGIISQYLPNLVTPEQYPPEYWDAVKELELAIEEEFGPELNSLPFPPNTPPENIIDSLPLSTEVDVDERFLINYFNGGFVREKGSSSWRNFNKLEIAYNELSIDNGAIERDKSTVTYTAIFPSDTIGDKAQIEYLKDKYKPYSFLRDFAPAELKQDDAALADILLKTLEDKYGYTWEQHIADFSDEELLNIINEISIINGYEEGKLWVKTRMADPSSEFNVDFEYEREGNSLPKITLNGRILPQEYFNILNTSVANAVAAKTNSSIKKRGKTYVKASKTEVKRQAIGKNIDTLRYAIMNSIAGLFPAEMDFMIPCSCEDFLCRLLNYIVQYFMKAFQDMLKQIMDMLIKFLIPDWVEDLLRLVKDFLNCLGSVFGIFKTIADVHEYANDLLDAMRGRIRLYPADPCFLPEDPFSGPRGTPDPGEGWDGLDPFEWEFPSPFVPPYETYYPYNGGDIHNGGGLPTNGGGLPTNGGGLPPNGGGGGGNGGDGYSPGSGFYPISNTGSDSGTIGYSPAPIIYPPVVPGIGDQGGNYPAFKFQCDYLWI